jgi:hypothetical protein
MTSKLKNTLLNSNETKKNISSPRNNTRISLFKRAAQNYARKNKEIEDLIKIISNKYNTKLSNNNLKNLRTMLNKIPNYTEKKQKIMRIITNKIKPRLVGVTIRANKKRKRNFTPTPSRFKN